MSKSKQTPIMKKAILLHQDDHVLTALEELKPGDRAAVATGGTVEVREHIRFGHKFAAQDIAQGQPVCKYGVPIGAALRPIRQGEHVHLHNLKSLQGREENEGISSQGWSNRHT